MARKERSAWDGSPTSSRSSSFSSTDDPQRGGRSSRQEVSRAMVGGASGPEAFTLLLLLVMTHFDAVDKEEGYAKLVLLECVAARLFLILVGSFAYLCRPLLGVSVFCLRGRMGCRRWFRWRRMSNFRFSCLRCTLVRRQRTRGHAPRWMLCGGRLVTKRIEGHVPSPAKLFFSFPVSSTGARGHPPRRGPGPPMMGAARAVCRPSRFRGRRD